MTGYVRIIRSCKGRARYANNQERLDQCNGILLLPNLDKAFDLGYITFTDVGSI